MSEIKIKIREDQRWMIDIIDFLKNNTYPLSSLSSKEEKVLEYFKVCQNGCILGKDHTNSFFPTSTNSLLSFRGASSIFTSAIKIPAIYVDENNNYINISKKDGHFSYMELTHTIWKKGDDKNEI